MPTINFPYYIQNRLPDSTCVVDAGVFVDCMRSLCAQYPMVTQYVFQDITTNTLASSTAFYINGVDVRTLDPHYVVTENDVIDIEPAIVGG